MSNIALTNLTAAVVSKQQEAVSGTVAKNKSAPAEKQQANVPEEVAVPKEGVDAGVVSPKTAGKFNFKNLLQKRMSSDTSKDQTGTSQSQKQIIANTVVTGETKKSESTQKEKKENQNPLLSAGWFTPQATEGFKKIVQLPKAKVDGALKAPQATPEKNNKTVHKIAAENTKVIDNKEVIETKPASKEAKGVVPVQQKEIKDTVEIKDAAVTTKNENSLKNGVSNQITSITQQKQTDHQNPGAESSTAGKDKTKMPFAQTQVTENKEDTKTDISPITSKKHQLKVQASAKTEISDTIQTVVSHRQPEFVSHVAVRQQETQVILTEHVTTTPIEKTAGLQPGFTPSEQIINKVQNTITASTQQIQVTLTPAELGTVRITFRQQDGQIEGLMEIQNPEVRKDVEKALPQIAAALAQNGIQVRRMDIAPMQNQQQTNQESFQSNEHDFNLKDQHYLANQGNSGGSEKSGHRISGHDVQLSNEMQSQAQQNYNLSGLNMFA